jgi:hypothetical protein
MANKMVEVNCETSEVVEREMTKNELSAEKKLQENEKKLIENDPLVVEQIAARQAILDRIGLTADELKTILG